MLENWIWFCWSREHIDALNARFAGYQNPPGIFLSEYDEQTEKLHKFILREQNLKGDLSYTKKGETKFFFFGILTPPPHLPRSYFYSPNQIDPELIYN